MAKQTNETTKFSPTAAQVKLGAAVSEAVNTMASAELGILSECAGSVWTDTVRAMLGGWTADGLKALIVYKELPKNTKATVRRSLSNVERAQALGVPLVDGANHVRGKTKVEADIKAAEGQSDDSTGPEDHDSESAEGDAPKAAPMAKADMVKAALALLSEDKALREQFAQEFAKAAECFSRDRAEALATKKAAKEAEAKRKAEAEAKAKEADARHAKDRESVNDEIGRLIRENVPNVGANSIASEPVTA